MQFVPHPIGVRLIPQPPKPIIDVNREKQFFRSTGHDPSLPVAGVAHDFGVKPQTRLAGLQSSGPLNPIGIGVCGK